MANPSDTRCSGGSDDLTGAWFGQYRYPDSTPPVSFIATIDDVGGTLSGKITEPNTFGLPFARNLSALLSGHHAGGQASFAKVYDGTGGVAHAVHYSGEISPDGSAITGQWSCEGWGSTFVMTREMPANEAQSAERKAEESEPV